MTTTDTESVVFTELDQAMAPPCELGGYDGGCPNPARWVMWLEPCCSEELVFRLACSQCKNSRMTSEAGVVCGRCKHVTEPARYAYARIESL